jgi:hypothetical protein
MNTVPSRLAVYSVVPSREIIGEKTKPACPDSVSVAVARRASQTITSPSSPVVTTERPSGVKRASLTAAAWRPEALRRSPVSRSSSRSEPSVPPIAMVRSSPLSAYGADTV